jgi:hypothetical protein
MFTTEEEQIPGVFAGFRCIPCKETAWSTQGLLLFKRGVVSAFPLGRLKAHDGWLPPASSLTDELFPNKVFLT